MKEEKVKRRKQHVHLQYAKTLFLEKLAEMDEVSYIKGCCQIGHSRELFSARDRGGGGDRQTDRDTDRETETDRNIQTDRNRDREGQTDRQTDRQRHRDRQTETERERWFSRCNSELEKLVMK